MDLAPQRDHFVFVLTNLVECGQRQRGIHGGRAFSQLLFGDAMAFQRLAASRAAIAAASSTSRAAPAISANCTSDVALAIGAVSPGRAICQASATCAGVA